MGRAFFLPVAGEWPSPPHGQRPVLKIRCILGAGEPVWGRERAPPRWRRGSCRGTRSTRTAAGFLEGRTEAGLTQPSGASNKPRTPRAPPQNHQAQGPARPRLTRDFPAMPGDRDPDRWGGLPDAGGKQQVVAVSTLPAGPTPPSVLDPVPSPPQLWQEVRGPPLPPSLPPPACLRCLPYGRQSPCDPLKGPHPWLPHPYLLQGAAGLAWGAFLKPTGHLRPTPNS